MGIEERVHVFSVELHLCMEGYCWRESQANNYCCYHENKNATCARKKHLGNERIYKNKCLPNSESLNFTWKTDIELITSRFIGAIFVFHVTVNVEFTRQAVNFSIVYTTQLNRAFRARWLASSEVISQVLFTCEQPKKNKMASHFN